MITNFQAEFDKALSEVDATNILKSSMKEIVSNMVNDEELCVLFYNKEEEEKKIWDSIRLEVAEKSKQEGIEQKEKEMIINMKSSGLTPEQISEYTKIPLERVEKLLEDK